MSTYTTTKTTYSSVKDRQCVQGILGKDGGGIGSTTSPMGWKQERGVDFPCYHVANSNTVLSLSRRCLVLILFSSDYFFPLFTTINTISTAIMRKMFLYQVYTNLAYVRRTYRRVKKLQILLINKDVRKSLARKNRNEILIWSWNNPTGQSVEVTRKCLVEPHRHRFCCF